MRNLMMVVKWNCSGLREGCLNHNLWAKLPRRYGVFMLRLVCHNVNEDTTCCAIIWVENLFSWKSVWIYGICVGFSQNFGFVVEVVSIKITYLSTGGGWKCVRCNITVYYYTQETKISLFRHVRALVCLSPPLLKMFWNDFEKLYFSC